MSIKLPTRRLVSQDDAAMIERSDVPRSRFQGSWTRKAAYNAGILYPFLVDEILPGDHMRYDVSAYLRMSTLLYPLMDNQRVDTHFFFVPMRLLWSNWKKFMGEQATPASSIDYTIPTFEAGTTVASIFDHMGLPVANQLTNPLEVNVLPFRAYNKIWNDWFRDENIQDSAPENMGDGGDSANDYTLKRRDKSHDYFTSALPWPQKFTAPTVPIGGLAPVLGIGVSTQNAGPAAGPIGVYDAEGINSYTYYKRMWNPDPDADDEVFVQMDAATGALPQIYADLSQATGVAINTLRQAWLVQSLLERDARGGTRYVELIRSHFGVISPDFRLQRPEYIGGGQTPLSITPIAQTAPTEDAPLGALGAAGTAAGGHHASYAATEHGYILGLISIKSELSYQQGLHRMWTRQTREDFPFPALMGLGEQAILRKEIYATGVDANDDLVFGYQERWHEFRTRYSEVVGILRSTAVGTLDMWHLAQNFTAPPTLSDSFISDSPPMTRVLAAGTEANGQQYIADIEIRRNAVRPISMFGTPAALGRF